MRVATFNVGCRELSYFISKLKADEVLASADVIFLQEIESYNIEGIEGTLEKYGYHCLYTPSRDLDVGTHGVAILSKIQITDPATLVLPQFDLRFRSRKRIAIRGLINFGTTTIQVCNVHLDSRLNIKERIQQLTPVLETFNKEHSKIVMGGDFNTVPFKFHKNIFPIGYSNQSHHLNTYLNEQNFRTFKDRPRYSMKMTGLRWLLDHIYVQNLGITQYGIRGSIITSDHVPVWADVDIS